MGDRVLDLPLAAGLAPKPTEQNTSAVLHFKVETSLTLPPARPEINRDTSSHVQSRVVARLGSRTMSLAASNILAKAPMLCMSPMLRLAGARPCPLGTS